MNERVEHGSPTEGPAIAAEGLSRLLIVLPGWAGDCALATPALRAIRHAMPRVTIGALVHANLAPLFDPCPWIDELVLVPPRRSRVPDSWPAGLVTTVRAMTAGRFDLVLLLRGGFRSALEARIAGIPRRVGFSGDLRGALLTTAIPRPRGTSTPESYLLLSRALGADGDLRLELQTQPDDDRHAAALLDSISEGGRRGVLLLSPGGPRAAKLWGDKRFAAVARRGHEELGLAIVLNGSPDDASRLRRVATLATCRRSTSAVTPSTSGFSRASSRDRASSSETTAARATSPPPWASRPSPSSARPIPRRRLTARASSATYALRPGAAHANGVAARSAMAA